MQMKDTAENNVTSIYLLSVCPAPYCSRHEPDLEELQREDAVKRTKEIKSGEQKKSRSKGKTKDTLHVLQLSEATFFACLGVSRPFLKYRFPFCI